MESRSVTASEAQILLVEDSPGDVRLLKETLRESQINNRLHVVTDGQEALNFIHRTDGYEDTPRPDIALLDLRLPQMSGEELLHEIKHHPPTADARVIILSESTRPAVWN